MGDVLFSDFVPVEKFVRCALLVEEAAVVGGHVERGIALVDRAEESVQVVPEVRVAAGERHPAGDGLLCALGQVGEAVLVVAFVVEGQQAARLGVEQKQKAVEETQRGAVHVVGDRLGIARATGADVILVEARGEGQEDMVEHALLQRVFQRLGVGVGDAA